MTKSKNRVENDDTAAASQIKTATLKAAKNLSRAQAERAATAAARNVNAYGQKEEGPSRWQERKEAKRQMYLMSTEKAVKLGVRKDLKSSGDRNVTSQQCQKCLQIGHWTYDCKNERIYVSRPSRSRLLKDLKLPPRLNLGESSALQLVSREEVPETLKDDNKRKRPMDSDSDSDESGSPPDSEPESEESSSSSASSSGTFSSSTFSTPSRTSSSSKKSTDSTVSINTPPDSEDGESDSGNPSRRKKKEEYRGMTTEDACKKGQRRLRNAGRKMELSPKNKKKRRNKKR